MLVAQQLIIEHGCLGLWVFIAWNNEAKVNHQYILCKILICNISLHLLTIVETWI
jgi:hypothetical protein